MITAHARDSEVVLDVTDEGPGVAPSERERVFDPFFQGKARADAPVKGTGLGLAIVREYVMAHGGKVDIVDSRGQGAHFQVRLPASAPAPGR